MDESLLRDREGESRLLGSQSRHDFRRVEQRMMRNPKQFICRECNSQLWYVITDAHPYGEGLTYLKCRNCRAETRPFGLRAPQMNDYRAKETGFYIADDGPTYSTPIPVIDTIIEVEQEIRPD